MIHKQSQSGFTLIEMIVSLGVFSFVITIAVGALLVLIASNQQLQSEQSVMTNLSFALDSMTREIRTGTHYFCENASNYSQFGPKGMFDGDVDALLPGNETQDCHEGNVSNRQLQGVTLIEGGDSITGGDKRILYFYDADARTIFRKVGNQDAQAIVSSGIDIVHAEFYVTGSTVQGDTFADNDQPSVTIFIEATDASAGASAQKPFFLQTTITQRALDI